MFYGEHPGSERVGRVVERHRHRPLRDDRAAIELLVDEMYGDPGQSRARRDDRVVDAMPVHAVAPEGGKQRRVHVQDASGPAAHHRGRDESQIAGQDHQVRVVRREFLLERFRRRASRNVHGGNTAQPCALERVRLGAVAHHQRHRGAGAAWP